MLEFPVVPARLLECMYQTKPSSKNPMLFVCGAVKGRFNEEMRLHGMLMETPLLPVN
jgi:hypothetical protein